MIKKMLMALLVGGFGLGLAQAQGPMAPGKNPEMKKEMNREMKEERKEKRKEKRHEKKEKTNMCKGTVEAVDAATGKITVKDGKGMVMTMAVGIGAKVTKDGKPAVLADIMTGDKVQVAYEGGMDNPTVMSVKVKKQMKKDKGMKKGLKVEEPKM